MNICVARDEAFNFTYRANLDSLARLGQVSFFSPLRDSHLPACSLLYLPGGYPELYAQQLAANGSMRCSIRDFALSNGHVYAECGGFMYLCQEIIYGYSLKEKDLILWYRKQEIQVLMHTRLYRRLL